MKLSSEAKQPRVNETRCPVCPLNRVREGVAVRVKQVCASPQVQSRLREMGFCEDKIVKLLISQTSFICQVCNTRLAISEELASMILVEPLQVPALEGLTLKSVRR